ncbi:hypothetical protein PGTUg99_012876 [Puccinia graminis f. sp. tritici]|uniref:Uncharacterized protein n=1 Tax=Puccinia graminis f. sp. tritici TaxID=56615 RepID=A0A5B0RVQ8_PUCGR|nr:hypothetical protein PGTUg99_012876 [Puccinia graminis f. sp. tritici]
MHSNIFPKSRSFRCLLQVRCRREFTQGSLIPSINSTLHRLPCSLHFRRLLSVCRQELKTSSSRFITTRSLISPLSDTAFKRLFSEPALLKAFLNSIFDKEGFAINEIKQTAKLVCSPPASQEPVSVATQEVHSLSATVARFNNIPPQIPSH